MSYSCGAVILAAGEGKRLRINLPKPLAPVLGKRLIDFPVSELLHFYKRDGIQGEISIITGHQKTIVEDYLSEHYLSKGVDINFAFQEKQLGTADALKTYFNNVETAKSDDYTVVICADTPMIRCKDLEELFQTVIKNDLDGVAATFCTENPTGYGRVVRGKKDLGFHIVEEKDATLDIRKIQEVNSGVYVLKTSFVVEQLEKIDCSNKSNEFYLTDLFHDKHKVKALIFNDPNTFIGVNNLEQLELVGRLLKEEKNGRLRNNGIIFKDASTNYIDWDVVIQPGTTIYPNVVIEGDSKIGKNSVIETGSIIINSELKDNVTVKAYTHLEKVIIRSRTSVGPFARIRPGVDIGENAKIGNFVEMKKATLEKGVKVSHLSYVGDAIIGENSNLGCGFITCNYDGANKHMTKIGKNCFIGSDSQAIAPVDIGDRCFVASGTTITESMPEDSFAIARVKQTTKEGMASRFMRTKKKK